MWLGQFCQSGEDGARDVEAGKIQPAPEDLRSGSKPAGCLLPGRLGSPVQHPSATQGDREQEAREVHEKERHEHVRKPKMQ